MAPIDKTENQKDTSPQPEHLYTSSPEVETLSEEDIGNEFLDSLFNANSLDLSFLDKVADSSASLSDTRVLANGRKENDESDSRDTWAPPCKHTADTSGAKISKRQSMSSAPPPPLGRFKVGRYEVIYPMAAGGMASVHMGRLSGLAGFERLVAIKVIHPHLSNQKLFVDMFLDEARLAAQLHHPNIGEIIEVGVDRGQLYMVGELIMGRNLRKLFNRAQKKGVIVSQTLSAYVMSRVCRGLHAAHELTGEDGQPLNLVHRDVSPRNIMISFSGDVKLIDFGIVHADGRLSHTEVGLFKGKSGFASPEQARGEALDRRSDIFSMGVTLYLLLTGTLPFEANTDYMRVIKLQKGEFPLPSRLNPNVDRELERIVVKAMQTRPEDRYQTAAELGYELEGFLAHMDYVDFITELSDLMHRFFSKELKEHNNVLRQHRRAAGENSTQFELNQTLASQLPAYEDSQSIQTNLTDLTGADEITAVERLPQGNAIYRHVPIVNSKIGIAPFRLLLGILQQRRHRFFTALAVAAVLALFVSISILISPGSTEATSSQPIPSPGLDMILPVKQTETRNADAMQIVSDMQSAAPRKATLRIATSQRGYAVLVDSVLLGRDLTTFELPVDDSQHLLTVRKADYQDFNATFTTQGNRVFDVALARVASVENPGERQSESVSLKKKRTMKQKPKGARVKSRLQDSPYE